MIVVLSAMVVVRADVVGWGVVVGGNVELMGAVDSKAVEVTVVSCVAVVAGANVEL